MPISWKGTELLKRESGEWGKFFFDHKDMEFRQLEEFEKSIFLIIIVLMDLNLH